MARTSLSRHAVIWLVVCATAAVSLAPAAEIRFRARCATSAAVLTLGELAEIFSNDPNEARQLAAVELGPSPVPGQPRFVRVREIQDAMWAQRVNLPSHQFSGYGVIEVTRPVEKVENPPVEKVQPPADSSCSAEETRRATTQVQRALGDYLQGRGAEPGKIEFQLTDAQVRAVLAAPAAVAVDGGMPPWTRQQRLELIVGGPESESRSPLDVRVASSVAVVVPLRPIPRGNVVRSEDVQVTQATFTTAVPRGLSNSLDEVVGREAVRPLAEGRPLSNDALRSPILIRRGEVVTVYALSPGVKVRSVARARDDAGLGDQITLETLHDRKAILARVTGPQEAEVCGAPPPTADRSRRSGTSQRERSTR